MQSEIQPENVKQCTKKRFQLYFALLLSLILLVLIVTIPLSWYYSSIKPADPSGRPNLFEVRKGIGGAEIAQNLDEAGYIRSGLAFRILQKRLKADDDIKAGTYRISPSMSPEEILNILVSGQVYTVKVTIPEGLTSQEIADLLVEKKIIDDRQAFLRKAAEKELEGRLFPDTYLFSPDVTEDEVINTMAMRFNAEVIEATGKQDFDSPAFKRLLILASIIEKEAKVPSDRPLIASVFINRLRKGIKLESCATVQYALGERRTRLLYADLKVNSPYNTYLYKDLPPGPICNPGIASLKAALFPAKTSYYFFVAGPDGKHVFSETYSEHLAAQKRLNISGEANIK